MTCLTCQSSQVHMSYNHLSQYERYQIQWCASCGMTVAAIAEHLQRHRSTIGRELVRNAGALSYCAEPSAAAGPAAPVPAAQCARL